MNSRDIPSLYTSIPSELAIEAASYWLHRKSELIPDDQRMTL